MWWLSIQLYSLGELLTDSSPEGSSAMQFLVQGHTRRRSREK